MPNASMMCSTWHADWIGSDLVCEGGCTRLRCTPDWCTLDCLDFVYLTQDLYLIGIKSKSLIFSGVVLGNDCAESLLCGFYKLQECLSFTVSITKSRAQSGTKFAVRADETSCPICWLGKGNLPFPLITFCGVLYRADIREGYFWAMFWLWIMLLGQSLPSSWHLSLDDEFRD